MVEPGVKLRVFPDDLADISHSIPRLVEDDQGFGLFSDEAQEGMRGTEGRLYRIPDVRLVDISAHERKVLGSENVAGDGFGYAGAGGRREGAHDFWLNSLDAFAQFQVRRPESFAPFADAVRLVDREMEDFRLGEEIHQPRRRQALGIGDDDPGLAAAHGFLALSSLFVLHPSTKDGAGDAAPFKASLLIVHQCEEGIDDDARSRGEECWQLETEALAEPGWEKHELAHLLSRLHGVQDVGDSHPLEREEVVDAKFRACKGGNGIFLILWRCGRI